MLSSLKQESGGTPGTGVVGADPRIEVADAELSVRGIGVVGAEPIPDAVDVELRPSQPLEYFLLGSCEVSWLPALALPGKVGSRNAIMETKQQLPASMI